MCARRFLVYAVGLTVLGGIGANAREVACVSGV